MAFICSCCEYVTDNKSNYNRHCKTKIHKTNVDIEFTIEELDIINSFLEIIKTSEKIEINYMTNQNETNQNETKQNNNPYGMSEEQYKEFQEYLLKPLPSDKDVERMNKDNRKCRKEREKRLIDLENQKEARIKQLTIEQNKKWNDMYYEEEEEEE